MAVDKLVDSSQLNSNLTSVANAIRTKGGTSAQLAFPAGFVSAIGDISTGITPDYPLKIACGKIKPSETTSKITVPCGDMQKVIMATMICETGEANVSQYLPYRPCILLHRVGPNDSLVGSTSGAGTIGSTYYYKSDSDIGAGTGFIAADAVVSNGNFTFAPSGTTNGGFNENITYTYCIVGI